MGFWRFKYDGPIAPVDDRNCPYCNAVATGVNPKVGSAAGAADPIQEIVDRKTRGLPVHCPNHAGIGQALDAHLDDHADHDLAEFQAFADIVKARVSRLPPSVKHIEVVAWGDDAQPDVTQHFAAWHVHIRVPHDVEPPRYPRPNSEEAVTLGAPIPRTTTRFM